MFAITCNKESNKHEETLSAHDNKVEGKTLITSENQKNHVILMFVCMNVVNTSFIESINVRAHHKIQP